MTMATKAIGIVVSESGGRITIFKDDFHSQMKLISEQYSSIKETLDSHTKTKSIYNS